MKDIVYAYSVTQTVSRYFRGLDERCFDEKWTALFAPDVVVELPPGTCLGNLNQAQFHNDVLTPFSKTHHMTSDHLIEIKGDEAYVRANLHVSHAYIGSSDVLVVDGVVSASLRLNAQGWVFSNLTLSPVFRDGKVAL